MMGNQKTKLKGGKFSVLMHAQRRGSAFSHLKGNTRQVHKQTATRRPKHMGL
jgi:hypothetical protein